MPEKYFTPGSVDAVQEESAFKTTCGGAPQFGAKVTVHGPASVVSVVGKVLRQCLRYAVVGIAAGSVLALGVSKLCASVLVIVDTFDPAGYAFGVMVVLAACVAAAWAPSQRAAQVNPAEMLREE